VTKQQPRENEIPFSRFREAVEQNKIAEVTELVGTKGLHIRGKYRDEPGHPGEAFKTFAPEDPDLQRMLHEKGVEVKASPEDNDPWYVVAFIQWAPMLLLIGVWIFFMRQMQVGGGKAMSFGKSRAKLLTENQHKVTFSDVAGIEESKEELEEIIAFLKDPKKFTKLGGRIPKGVLLVGPPGTGKTLLARAVAGEAGVPFFSISGSDFVEMFVGVGASRVRDLFVQGKKNAPCIIFIDEIDAVGRHRGAGLGGGHDEREQTLNQLLVEMDGFETNEGVILIAATNRPDVLDPALLRPGRFDRRVVVPRPDVKGREGILRVHMRRVPTSEDVDISLLARQTPGFAGADLENLVNEAALLAARQNKDRVEMADFEIAKDKVLMGSERRSMIISEGERRITAYHEAGHALVAKLVPGTDPVHKVTIIPRGMALGLTQQVPLDDRHTYSREYLLGDLAIFFGGRAAEELVLGSITTGAGNDIERATDLARKMVCEWGMSEKLGPMTFGKKEEEIFLGRDFTQRVDYSETTAVAIDAEVRRILMDAYERARLLLRRNVEALHRVAAALLERESLDGSEIDVILQTLGGEPGPAAATA
jgi:cell division protease FtsH